MRPTAELTLDSLSHSDLPSALPELAGLCKPALSGGQCQPATLVHHAQLLFDTLSQPGVTSDLIPLAPMQHSLNILPAVPGSPTQRDIIPEDAALLSAAAALETSVGVAEAVHAEVEKRTVHAEQLEKGVSVQLSRPYLAGLSASLMTNNQRQLRSALDAAHDHSKAASSAVPRISPVAPVRGTVDVLGYLQSEVRHLHQLAATDINGARLGEQTGVRDVWWSRDQRGCSGERELLIGKLVEGGQQ